MSVLHTLLEGFELKGEWWLPGQRENLWFAGILRYDAKKGITLELGGAFADRSTPFPDVPVNWAAINGAPYQGPLCTLFDARLTARHQSSRGTLAEVYSVDPLVLGGCFNSIDEMKFDSFSVSYTDFEKWCKRKPFDVDRHHEKLKWNSPEPIEVATDAIGADIRIVDYLATSESVYARHTWSATTRFEIIPNTPQALRWCADRSWDFQNLLTLLMGYPCLRRHMSGIVTVSPSDGRKTGPPVEVFAPFIGSSEITPSRSKLPLVFLPTLRDSFPHLLNTWFARVEQRRAAHNIFFSSLYAPSKFQDTRFLVLTQAIEAFYRRKYDDDSIQRERYKRLFADLGASTAALLTDELEVFVDRIVDTRNDLTHRFVERKENVFTDEKLFLAAEALEILMRMLLMKDVGVSDSLITERFSKHWDYSRWLKRIKGALGQERGKEEPSK